MDVDFCRREKKDRQYATNFVYIYIYIYMFVCVGMVRKNMEKEDTNESKAYGTVVVKIRIDARALIDRFVLSLRRWFIDN